MNELEARDTLIAGLRFQVELAARYIREHVKGDPRRTDEFMLLFAEACEDVSRRALPGQVLGLHEALLHLEMMCRPCFNNLAQGRRDPFWEQEVRKALERIARLRGDLSDLAWVQS